MFARPGYRSGQNASDGQDGNLVVPVSLQSHPIQNASKCGNQQTHATVLELYRDTAITCSELVVGLRIEHN